MANDALDVDILREKQALIGQMGAWCSVAAVAALGLRLGLYAAMGDCQATTAAQLAAKVDCNERLILEWLRCQSAAGLIAYDGEDLFRLTPEVAVLLADESTLQFAGAPFLALPMRVNKIPLVETSFRTGLGHGWDESGPDQIALTEFSRRAWFQQELIPNVLPLLEGVSAKLEAGASVADVGCGTGVALISMAEAFPRSSFHGFEVSLLSLEKAQANRATAGVSNTRFADATMSPLPDAGFDLVMTLDYLHDMTHPEAIMSDIRRALKPNGTWFIMEFDCADSFEENLKRGAVFAANGYATSTLLCLPSSMSEPGSLGFGTLGLPESRLASMAKEAGFSRFRRVKTDGRWALFEARP